MGKRSNKTMPQSERLRLAEGYRSNAGKLFYHLKSGKAKDCGVLEPLERAHAALCEAAAIIEKGSA